MEVNTARICSLPFPTARDVFAGSQGAEVADNELGMWISIRPCFKNPGKVSTIGLNHRIKSEWQMQVRQEFLSEIKTLRFTPSFEPSNCPAFLLRKCI
jgi:hypothetical protein